MTKIDKDRRVDMPLQDGILIPGYSVVFAGNLKEGGGGYKKFSLQICPKFSSYEAISRWKGRLSLIICDHKGVGEIQHT